MVTRTDAFELGVGYLSLVGAALTRTRSAQGTNLRVNEVPSSQAYPSGGYGGFQGRDVSD